ncbi:MAG: FAD-dependent oxidoreductase [Chloroflexota bacterium]|nr:FAD-dependent oxidoreductase [Chloroflexota bacterium]
MRKADVVVVGGSAGGIPAAIGCRRRYPEKSVLLIRKEEQVLIPCGLPYIFGTVGGPEENLIPDAMLKNNGIDITVGEVEEIDRDKKAVSIAGGETVSYDKLVLATGSSPVILPIPGVDKENVFSAVKDVTYLNNMLDEVNKAKDIIIIGGGFIGVEFADECKKNRDNSVTIIEMLPHCLQLALDEEFCTVAEKVLVERGVKVLTNKRVEAILGNKRVNAVRLAGGQELKADMVIIGVGARPNVELAEKAGLQIGPTRAIVVDRLMRTITDPNIFACGDCAEKYSFFNGKPSLTMLASIATAEARIVGANLFDTRYRNCGEIGVFSTIIGEQAFGCAGLTEKMAKQEGYDVVTGEATAPDRHPGGMPGAASTKVKLVFSKDNGLLLGGGISGGRSTGDLTNIISACIQHMMTAYEVSLFQMGTHPALTASPMVYQLVNAAELAVRAM